MSTPFRDYSHPSGGEEGDGNSANNHPRRSSATTTTTTISNGSNTDHSHSLDPFAPRRRDFAMPTPSLPQLVSHELSLPRRPGSYRTESDSIDTFAMDWDVIAMIRLAEELNIRGEALERSWNAIVRYSLLNIVLNAVRRSLPNPEYAFAPLAAEDLEWLQLRLLSKSLIVALEANDCGRCTICQEDFSVVLQRHMKRVDSPSTQQQKEDVKEGDEEEEDEDEEEDTDTEDRPHNESTGINNNSEGSREGGEERVQRQPRQQRMKIPRRSPLTVCRLPCNHVFCYACLMRWLKRTASCPNCRAEIKELQTMYATGEGRPPSWWLAMSPCPSPLSAIKPHTNEDTVQKPQQEEKVPSDTLHRRSFTTSSLPAPRTTTTTIIPIRFTPRPVDVNANSAVQELDAPPSLLATPHSTNEAATQDVTRNDSWMTFAYPIEHSNTNSSSSSPSSSSSSNSSSSQSSSSLSLSSVDGDSSSSSISGVSTRVNIGEERATQAAGTHMESNATTPSITLLSASSSVQPSPHPLLTTTNTTTTTTTAVVGRTLRRVSSLLSSVSRNTPYSPTDPDHSHHHGSELVNETAVSHETMRSVNIHGVHTTTPTAAGVENNEEEGEQQRANVITPTEPRRLSSGRSACPRRLSRPSVTDSERRGDEASQSTLPTVLYSPREPAHASTTTLSSRVTGNEAIPRLSAPRQVYTPGLTAPATNPNTTTTNIRKDSQATMLPAVGGSPGQMAPPRTMAMMRRLPCTRRPPSRTTDINPSLYDSHRLQTEAERWNDLRDTRHVNSSAQYEPNNNNRGIKDNEANAGVWSNTQRWEMSSRASLANTTRVSSTTTTPLTTALALALAPDERPPSSSTSRVLRSPQRRPRSPAAPAPPSHRPARMFTRRGHFSVTSHNPTSATITTPLVNDSTSVDRSATYGGTEMPSSRGGGEVQRTQRERRGHVLLRPVMLQQQQQQQSRGQASPDMRSQRPSH